MLKSVTESTAVSTDIKMSSSGEPSCTICRNEVINEFQCTTCEYALHFTCSLGFTIPDALRETLNLAEYKCPACVVGSSYELLHRALDSHRIQSNLNRLPSPIGRGDHTPPRNNTFLATYGETTPTRDETTSSRANNSHLESSAHSVRDFTNGQRSPADPDLRTTRGADAHNNQVNSGVGDQPQYVTPLRNQCAARRNKLSYILRSLLQNLPDKATTILLGDSLQKGLVKKDIDRDTDSVRIRSVGGLCVYATVQALSDHRGRHPKVKKVGFTVGINDFLHRDIHTEAEFPRYIKGLQIEASRVFPNAILYFVLPYRGMFGQHITDSVQTDLQALLKTHAPKIRVLTPPNLTGKVNDGGIHPSDAGNQALTKWYSNTFVPPSSKTAPFPANSGRTSVGRPYSQAHIHPVLPEQSNTAPAVGRVPPPTHHHPSSVNQQPQQELTAYNGLASEIVGAFTQMMSMWGHQPPQQYRLQPQQWPPITIPKY